jgi:hypothetical protein
MRRVEARGTVGRGSFVSWLLPQKGVIMKRSAIAVLVGVLLLFVALPAFGASGLEGRWHRDNYGNSHEVLICNGSQIGVRCQYLQVPEPSLGILPTTSDTTRGMFEGVLVDAAACPAYMADACGEAVVIAQGTAKYTSGIITEQTIAVHADGSMTHSWDTPDFFGSPFVCPWYDSYDRALSESPHCEFIGS